MREHTAVQSDYQWLMLFLKLGLEAITCRRRTVLRVANAFLKKNASEEGLLLEILTLLVTTGGDGSLIPRRGPQCMHGHEGRLIQYWPGLENTISEHRLQKN